MTQHIEEARKLADRIVGLWITHRNRENSAIILASALAAAEAPAPETNMEDKP